MPEHHDFEMPMDAATIDAIAASPSFDVDEPVLIDLDGFLKARPVTEGDRRFVFFEASNEAVDTQAESIMADALWESRDLYAEKGNIDIEHLTVIGYKLGIPFPRDYEIGRPVEVKRADAALFVKGEIYRGHEQADKWWKTQTAQEPPMKWYPSAGGRTLARRVVFDPTSGTKRTIITKTAWTNVAFAQEPVNQTVQAVKRVPFGVFAKARAWALAHGIVCECDDAGVCACRTVSPGEAAFGKAVTAGYGTDSAGLTGGGALRVQSIQRGQVLDLWESPVGRFAKAIGSCACAHTEPPFTTAKLTEHFMKCEGMNKAAAAATSGELLPVVAARAA